MKDFIFLFIITAIAIGCGTDATPERSIQEIRTDGNAGIIRNPISASEIQDTVNVARLEFAEPVFNFGEVEEGEIVSRNFEFTNTGKVPLIINGARSTCGCTVPTWPKEPIAPGEKGEIEVKFNTLKKRNDQQKVVTVTANTYPMETKVLLEGFVNPMEEATE